MDIALDGKWKTTDLAPDYPVVTILITPGIEPTRDGLISFTGSGGLSGASSGVHLPTDDEAPSAIIDFEREALPNKGSVEGTFIITSSTPTTASTPATITVDIEVRQGGVTVIQKRNITFTQVP